MRFSTRKPDGKYPPKIYRPCSFVGAKRKAINREDGKAGYARKMLTILYGMHGKQRGTEQKSAPFSDFLENFLPISQNTRTFAPSNENNDMK